MTFSKQDIEDILNTLRAASYQDIDNYTDETYYAVSMVDVEDIFKAFFSSKTPALFKEKSNNKN